ncbi:hypothetical protein [Clostridium hydrogeniformans]|uniref:hypothetical protein n=1 Tax=Clostridium hydrogeniformans TaxID=349933 RepID=UPI000ACE182C|nr:hypothetical protein [Clostridium hydrogeniformans]
MPGFTKGTFIDYHLEDEEGKYNKLESLPSNMPPYDQRIDNGILFPEIPKTVSNHIERR